MGDIIITCGYCRHEYGLGSISVILRRFADNRYDYFEYHCGASCEATRQFVASVDIAIYGRLHAAAKIIYDEHPLESVVEAYQERYARVMPVAVTRSVWQFFTLDRVPPI